MGKTFRANSKSYGTSEGKNNKIKQHKKKNTLKEDHYNDYMNIEYNDIYELDDLENGRNKHKTRKEKGEEWLDELDYAEDE